MKILVTGEAKATHPKVSRSVKKIKKQNDIMNDVKVLVDGYEGGLDAVLDVSIVNVKYDDTQKWYYGPFEECDSCDETALRIISTRGNRT